MFLVFKDFGDLVVEKEKKFGKTDAGAVVGTNSKRIEEFKKKTGLPTLRELGDLQDKGLVEQVEYRLSVIERYAAAQQHLMNVLNASGYTVANVLNDVVVLQAQLWELEEALKAEGKNPLTDNNYMRARKQLMEQMQFINKQKLDVAKFQKDLDRKKERSGDDDLFTVESE